ncbi:hypothetical protein FF38_10975 [Lucilia cuprina]|uniref:Uncharacterized protein n=1 Tax=Lucilia cuprina TaxID=7375 RepID=A0A0L0BXJ0_LUCCU|nr:hypothetical protein FF38_10975 [Lucilia cuprina]
MDLELRFRKVALHKICYPVTLPKIVKVQQNVNFEKKLIIFYSTPKPSLQKTTRARPRHSRMFNCNKRLRFPRQYNLTCVCLEIKFW